MEYYLDLCKKRIFHSAKRNSFVGAERKTVHKMLFSAGKFLIVELLMLLFNRLRCSAEILFICLLQRNTKIGLERFLRIFFSCANLFYRSTTHMFQCLYCHCFFFFLFPTGHTICTQHTYKRLTEKNHILQSAKGMFVLNCFRWRKFHCNQNPRDIKGP